MDMLENTSCMNTKVQVSRISKLYMLCLHETQAKNVLELLCWSQSCTIVLYWWPSCFFLNLIKSVDQVMPSCFGARVPDVRWHKYVNFQSIRRFLLHPLRISTFTAFLCIFCGSIKSGPEILLLTLDHPYLFHSFPSTCLWIFNIFCSGPLSPIHFYSKYS